MGHLQDHIPASVKIPLIMLHLQMDLCLEKEKSEEVEFSSAAKVSLFLSLSELTLILSTCSYPYQQANQ